MERDGGFDYASAENGEGFVVLLGERSVSHGATKKINALEGVPELFLEGFESGGKGRRKWFRAKLGG